MSISAAASPLTRFLFLEAQDKIKLLSGQALDGQSLVSEESHVFQRAARGSVCLVMGSELSQGNETLHRPHKLYVHHGPLGVVFLAGCIIVGIVFLKLCVVWVSLLHNLKSDPSLKSFVQSAPQPDFSLSPASISWPTWSHPVCLPQSQRGLRRVGILQSEATLTVGSQPSRARCWHWFPHPQSRVRWLPACLSAGPREACACGAWDAGPPCCRPATYS